MPKEDKKEPYCNCNDNVTMNYCEKHSPDYKSNHLS